MLRQIVSETDCVTIVIPAKTGILIGALFIERLPSFYKEGTKGWSDIVKEKYYLLTPHFRLGAPNWTNIDKSKYNY